MKEDKFREEVKDIHKRTILLKNIYWGVDENDEVFLDEEGIREMVENDIELIRRILNGTD